MGANGMITNNKFIRDATILYISCGNFWVVNKFIVKIVRKAIRALRGTE